MTINDLLDIAIRNEIASQELYSVYLSLVTDKDARVFLEELVREEKIHEETLTNIKELEIYDGSVTLDQETLSELLETTHKAFSDVTNASTIQDILEIALQREHYARSLFLQLANASTHPELKLMFEKLAAEELSHHQRIQKKYAAQRCEMGFEM